MSSLLLVDGSNLLFQMFYGMPSRIVNHQGKAIHGTLGFVGALLKTIRMVQPSHVAVLFDGECTNARSAVDGAYKANRPDYSRIPEEDTPFSQLPDIYDALDYLKIPHAETTDCETDDWIAGYALRYGTAHQVTICSYDSDFFQLISDNVTVLRYRGKSTTLCDRAYIRSKLGIEPEQYAAFKSLTGDNADNIRGVPKIGPKTAAQLMNQFADPDALLSHTDRILRPSVRAAIEQHIPTIRNNYQLIRLRGDAPLPFPLEVLTYHDRGLTTGAVLAGIGLQ